MASEIAFSDCQTCLDLWRLLSDPDALDEINLGSFEDALATSCSRHVELVKRFRDHCSPVDDCEPAHNTKDVGIRQDGKGNSVHITESLSRGGYYWSMLLMKRDDILNHPGNGRLLDPKWADLDIARHWIATCLKEHGTRCDNPLKVPPSRPAWLIDVDNRCLVPGHEHEDFIALSYRYGSTLKLVLNQHSMTQLQERNSFDTPEIADQIAPIVWHAIDLTAALEQRYLWVDALCIARPDGATSSDALRLMGTVYASARMTIIAADDDAQTGLLGLQNTSEPRELQQVIIPFGEEKIVVRNTAIFSMSGGTPYYRRGWTYQEYTLSRRRLLFNRKELHWECSCSVWHEETTPGTRIDEYIDPRLKVLTQGFPDLGALSRLTQAYNERELTYDEDALPGISGLLDVVSRPFEGGFLCGLPEIFFDCSLGWQPLWEHTNLRRREPSRSADDRSSLPSPLPSWSWIGWQGFVHHGSEAWRINDRSNEIEETTLITEWYTSHDSNDPAPRKIKSSWYLRRDMLKKCSDDDLPPGWSRHPAPPADILIHKQRLYPDGCAEHVYKHMSMPDEVCDTFYYPYPIPTISETTSFFSPEQTPYLFCRTKRAHLWAWADPTTTNWAGHTHSIAIGDPTVDKKIGALRAANDEQFQQFLPSSSPLGTGDSSSAARRIELVAIYRYKRWSKVLNHRIEKDGSPGPRVTEGYCVLWIEWRRGVAYRLACGWVEREHWEALDLQDVDLVLG